MGGFLLCLHTNAEPMIRLKELAIDGYVYNPPQTHPLKRRDLLLPCGQPCLRRRCKRKKGLKGQKGSCGLEIVGLSWKILHCHYFSLTLYWCVVRLFEDTHHFNSKFYAL